MIRWSECESGISYLKNRNSESWKSSIFYRSIDCRPSSIPTRSTGLRWPSGGTCWWTWERSRYTVVVGGLRWITVGVMRCKKRWLCLWFDVRRIIGLLISHLYSCSKWNASAPSQDSEAHAATELDVIVVWKKTAYNWRWQCLVSYEETVKLRFCLWMIHSGSNTRKCHFFVRR